VHRRAPRSRVFPYTTLFRSAAQWDGWGTALKPAFEPIVLARKPLAEKTVARNVLAHGTGAINVDACRIDPGEAVPGGGGRKAGRSEEHTSELQSRFDVVCRP